MALFRRLLWPLLLILPAVAARAEAVRADHLEAELIAERTALVPGENWLALKLEPDAGWHTYWRNPGDSGIPTSLQWSLPAGFAAGPIQWPYPERHALGEVMNYGYGGQTLLLVALNVPADAARGKPVDLKAEAKWLVCSDICIPGKAELHLELPVADQAAEDPRWQDAFAQARARLPQAVDWPAQFAVDRSDFSLSLRAPQIAAADQIEFFPYAKDLVNHAAAQRRERNGEELRLSQNLSSFFLEAPRQVQGVLVLKTKQAAQAYEITAEPGAVAPVGEDSFAQPAPSAAPLQPRPKFALALGLALLGGLILNLMPCVFPVLSLKAIAVLETRDDRPRAQALAYTAGVMLAFVAVAALLLILRAGGERLGWGFQLQSPVFVAALAYLFFVLGLSLSGVLALGTSLMGIGQTLTQSRGLSGSFFTGVLAAVVASPCTAPFMGTALGYALTQSSAAALAVFAAMGLGLALPFLLLAFVPAAATWLPKPGAWMQRFKELMAFPLYLTAAWLLWVVARQSGADAAGLVAAGLVLIAFAVWLWHVAGLVARIAAVLASVSALGFLAALPQPRPTAPVVAPPVIDAIEPYSEARLAQLRAERRTVFVNFTADWCLTCKVNERAVLNRDSVRRAFAQQHVVEMVGDWTRPDPAITAALARFGRSGVPLYLVYREGGEPQVLPQILTPEVLIEAVSPPKPGG